MTTLAVPAPVAVRRTHAPLGRLLRSELRLILRRPRTLIALGLLVLVPIIAGIGIALAAGNPDSGGPGDGPGALASIVNDNGLVLPVFALFMAMQLLLPMVGSMWAADAIAGEASTGALRNLLVAPVGRARLLAIKAFGITGVTVLGGSGMLTMSGTTLTFWPAMGRIVLSALLVWFQILAVAAVALAISTLTEHPLVVMAATLGGIIVFGVLNAISSLDWLHPVLITQSWITLVDVMRDPMPTDGIVQGILRGACYIAIGYSLAFARMLTKDG
jgi:ABC-2 type transport system permease protein